MAYAPHNNGHVHTQILQGIVPSQVPMLLGQFREKEHGYSFEYAERRWPDDEFHPELPHVIFVHDAISGTSTRLAKVLGTVAYILVDENTLEKWQIKMHEHYDTSWVGRFAK